MFLKLFLAFTIIPVVEIYILIQIGSVMGAFNTVLLVIGTGFAGAYLARMQGLETLYRVRASLQQGIMPAEEIIDAVIILVAGVVLLTPGLITDIAGLLLLFPLTRLHFKRFFRKKLDEWIREQDVSIRRYP